MMKRALMPRFSACCTNFLVISRSLLTYLRMSLNNSVERSYTSTHSWRNCTWPGFALSTISSKEHDARVGIWTRAQPVLPEGWQVVYVPFG